MREKKGGGEGVCAADWFALSDTKTDNVNFAIDHSEMPSIATQEYLIHVNPSPSLSHQSTYVHPR